MRLTSWLEENSSLAFSAEEHGVDRHLRDSFLHSAAIIALEFLGTNWDALQ